MNTEEGVHRNAKHDAMPLPFETLSVPRNVLL